VDSVIEKHLPVAGFEWVMANCTRPQFHYNSSNLYLGMQLTTGNEPDKTDIIQLHLHHHVLPAQLCVHVLLCHYKSIYHVAQSS
jgi:hypothetical protein